jgi:hypothetical protein
VTFIDVTTLYRSLGDAIGSSAASMAENCDPHRPVPPKRACNGPSALVSANSAVNLASSSPSEKGRSGSA